MGWLTQRQMKNKKGVCRCPCVIILWVVGCEKLQCRCILLQYEFAFFVCFVFCFLFFVVVLCCCFFFPPTAHPLFFGGWGVGGWGEVGGGGDCLVSLFVLCFLSSCCCCVFCCCVFCFVCLWVFFCFLCEQVLFVRFTIIPPRLTDQCNFITVL